MRRPSSEGLGTAATMRDRLVRHCRHAVPLVPAHSFDDPHGRTHRRDAVSLSRVFAAIDCRLKLPHVTTPSWHLLARDLDRAVLIFVTEWERGHNVAGAFISNSKKVAPIIALMPARSSADATSNSSPFAITRTE
jgi:hypothetical protein